MKKTLLFLHGWASDASIWQKQKEFFRDHSVITPELDADNLDGNTEKVFALCKGLQEIVIIAWSMGALTALRLFEKGIDIKAFIGIGATAKFISEDYVAGGVKQSELRALRVGLKRDFAAMLNNFYAQHRIPLSAENSVAKKDLFIRQLDILEKEDLRSNLALIHCPSLFLVGEKDILCPKSVQEYMSARVAGSAVRVINDTAHAPCVERAKEINRSIEEFIC